MEHYMAIKAVIFDIGGVLLHNDGHKQSHTWETEHGLPAGAIFKYVNRSGLGVQATRGQITEQDVWNRVAAHFQIDPEVMNTFNNNFLTSEMLNTELADYLQSLRPAYKTALLSNAWSGIRELLTRKYALDKLTDVMFFSSEENTMKPDAKFYQLALMRLHVEANEIIFLDDKIVNIDGARLLGMHGIHYQDNAQAIAEIKRIIDRHTIKH